MKIVNFLEVTLNLSTGKYKPYTKDGNPPICLVLPMLTTPPPPSILKHLPKAIGYIISELSSDKDEFEKAAPIYNNALKTSGFKSTMEYTAKPKSNPE